MLYPKVKLLCPCTEILHESLQSIGADCPSIPCAFFIEDSTDNLRRLVRKPIGLCNASGEISLNTA